MNSNQSVELTPDDVVTLRLLKDETERRVFKNTIGVPFNGPNERADLLLSETLQRIFKQIK